MPSGAIGKVALNTTKSGWRAYRSSKKSSTFMVVRTPVIAEITVSETPAMPKTSATSDGKYGWLLARIRLPAQEATSRTW